MKFYTLIFALAYISIFNPSLQAEDWMFSPSYYSHNTETGERVTQHTPIGPFYIYPRPDFSQSGYRHRQSILRAGDRADRLHIIEQWGNPVRPYGEWLYPYRPYSVPYRDWGPPYGGLGHSHRGYGYWGPSTPYNAPPAGFQYQQSPSNFQQQTPDDENTIPSNSGPRDLY